MKYRIVIPVRILFASTSPILLACNSSPDASVSTTGGVSGIGTGGASGAGGATESTGGNSGTSGGAGGETTGGAVGTSSTTISIGGAVAGTGGGTAGGFGATGGASGVGGNSGTSGVVGGGTTGGAIGTSATTISTGGAVAGTGGGTAADSTFYDPVSTDHVTAAFALVHQYAASTLASPEVRFISVQGVPTGAPGATYDTTPLRWTYQFSACDASVQPCANTQTFTLTQPGLTVAGPFAASGSGLSLLETEFRAAVPLDFTQLLAGPAPNEQFCPIGPTALGTQYISLQGGTKSGSGNPLWYWTFQCTNVVNGTPVYRNSNGDPIT